LHADTSVVLAVARQVIQQDDFNNRAISKGLHVMASVTPPVSPESPAPPPRQPADTNIATGGQDERFIEGQLAKARGYVKLVDVVSGLMTLAAGTLIFFLVVALVDHWIVPGGLAVWSRVLLLLAFLGVAGYFVFRHVAPLLLKRINPVYAAHQIEQAQPAKNSLINFLLFRTTRQPMHRAVYRAVEHQAAGALAHVRVESTIDRSKLIKIGYVLLGAVVLCGLYKALSPKDPFQSLGRLALPWADIQHPTRVTLEDIQPGDKTVYRGAAVSISAAVRGLRQGEEVELIYTTDDRQITDRAIEMRLEQNRYVCDFSTASGGAQQSFTYRVAAGDVVSKSYQIEVIAAPAIEIDRIEYEYPQYTQLENRTETNARDVSAVEGTKVTIRAIANQPIEHARIEFELAGQEPLTMQIDGNSATRSFHLKYRGVDGLSPDRGRYRIRFTTAADSNNPGQDNPDPVDHYITIKPDLAPEVEFVYPREREVQVPLGGELSIEVAAVDRDFGLSSVRLQATRLDKTIVDVLLLDAKRVDPFDGKFRFVPSELGLKDEDVVLYRAVASDTKEPQANITETVWNRIVIVAPDRPDQLASNDRQDDPNADPNADRNSDQPNPEKQPNEGDPQQGNDNQQGNDDQQGNDNQQQGGDNQQGGSKQDGQQQDGSSGGKQDGQQSQDGDQSGESGQGGQSKPVANDGTEDGEAFERLDKHFDEQDDKPSTGKKDGQADPNAGEDQSGDSQPGKQSAKPDGGQSGNTDPSNADPNNTDPGGEKQPSTGDQKQQPGAKDSTSPDPSPMPGQDGGQKKPNDTPGPKDQPGKQDGTKTGTKPGTDKKPSEPMGDAKPGTGEGQKQPKPNGGDDQPGSKPDSGQKPGAKESDKPGDEKKQDPGAPGEDGQDGQGSGGQKKEDAAGGDADTEKRGTKNSQDKPGGKQGSDNAPSKSPAASDKPSESQGDDSSDRKGGGSEGGGQKDKQDGKGSAGSNTPADDGGGKADQPGKGEAGEQAGNDQKAPGKTGKPADDGSAGDGSKTEKRPDGNEPGDETGERQGDQQGPSGKGQDDTAPKKQQPGGKSGKTGGEGTSGDPTGGGKPPKDDPDRPRSPTVDPGGDKANLEYSRQVTDKVLDRLRQAIDKDADLSSVFRNTADAEKFYRRHDELRKKAKQKGDAGRAARGDLDDALRSLGLRKGSKKVGAGQRADRQRGLSTSRDTRPPAEYADQFKAYSQGRASKK
jgi:hypothetical protein